MTTNAIFIYLILIVIGRAKQTFVEARTLQMTEIRGIFSMDCGDRGTHA